MKRRLRKFRKIRIHREGTNQLLYGGIALVAIAILLWNCFLSGVSLPYLVFAMESYSISTGVRRDFSMLKIQEILSSHQQTDVLS